MELNFPGKNDDPLTRINRQLQALRLDNDVIAKGAKELKSGMTEFNKEEEAIREAFMKRLREVQDKKFALQADILNLETKLAGNIKTIEELSKEAAELLSKQDALKVLAALEATIREICEGFDAWDKARPFQHDDILFIINAYKSGKNGILNANDMGLGKGVPFGTKILTPSGYIPIENLTIGDQVIGSNGKPTTILGYYPHTDKETYKITFRDGSSINAWDDHRWAVKTSNHIKRGNDWKVKTTSELILDLKQQMGMNSYNKWFIPTVAPVRFNEQVDLPIDPYTLGILLGDGSFRASNILIEDYKNLVKSTILVGDDEWHYNGLRHWVVGTETRSELIKLGLWNHLSIDKFIPEIYKRASINDRRALIQGLMATDGYSNEKIKQFNSSSEQLMKDFREVVETLGEFGSVSDKIPTYDYKGRNLEGHRHWTFTFYKSQYRSIQSIEPVGLSDGACIAVDAKDHLYVTEHCIVTHNTFETAVSDFILTTLFEQEYGRKPNVLWLTKKSLVKSNLTEILMWSPERKCIPLMGGTPEQRELGFQLAMMGNAMLMCNYEAVRTTPMIAAADWDFIYIDEVHKLKGGANPNGPTAIWAAVRDICRRAKFMIFLSGTPMVNRWQEMWSYLHIFAPEQFPTLKRFELMCGNPVWSEKEQKIVVQVEIDKVMMQLKDQTIRRRRDEVKLQLPDLTREFIYLDRTEKQDEVYLKMRDNFYIWLDAQSDEKKALTATAIIAQLTRLRQINTWPDSIIYEDPITGHTHRLDVGESAKVDEAFDRCEQLIEADEQVVVFSAQFNGPLHELHRRLTSAGYKSACITGKETSAGETSYLEEKFQQKEIDVLLINMATGSEGLNLQKNPDRWPGGASHAIFMDLWYSPARNEQAEARIHRQGATDPVTIYILQCNDSVDAFIAAILEDKSAMFDKIMESDLIRPKVDWRDYMQGKV